MSNDKEEKIESECEEEDDYGDEKNFKKKTKAKTFSNDSGKAEASLSVPDEKAAVKREKRILRFQMPEMSHSEDSFTSALSVDLSDSREQIRETSFLKKYIMSPVRRSQPRTALVIPCVSTEELELETTRFHNTICLSNTSSSKQLFEILRNSPTPSDTDLNLINSTYLRKLDAMKEAIKNGADVNAYRDRQTPLMIATDIADERLVRYLLSVPKINPDMQNVFGQTPLMVAIKNAFDQIVELLLHHNANVNVSDNLGRTPLHEALFQQRPSMVKLLLAFGADFDQSDVFGERPMYAAAVRKPHMDCLKILLGVGASPEYHNAFGMTLLTRAILNFTHFEMIEMLISNGASVNSSNLNTGMTPLHFAAIINDLKIADLLLSKGANANVKTYNDVTPYDEAILHKSIDVAEFLFPITDNANLRLLNAIKNPKEN